MIKNNQTRVFNIALNNQNLRLKMKINTEIYVKDNGKVQRMENLIDKMNLNRLKSTYFRKIRSPVVNPIIMLITLLLQ